MELQKVRYQAFETSRQQLISLARNQRQQLIDANWQPPNAPQIADPIVISRSASPSRGAAINGILQPGSATSASGRHSVMGLSQRSGTLT